MLNIQDDFTEYRDTLSDHKRSAGILAHITSLPGKYGIGDIGYSSFSFLDFLQEAGQRCWQFLPLGPSSAAFDFSPYMSDSSFAGNPLLISLEGLRERGWLRSEDLINPSQFSEYLVEFRSVEVLKKSLLKKAFTNFISQTKEKNNLELLREFQEDEPWLEDYALFEVLRERYYNQPWYLWPDDIASFEKGVVNKARIELEEKINYHRFVQFVFHQQWKELRTRADKKGIRLFGDMPVYVAPDSADVWANQGCFLVDRKTHEFSAVSGVPPDYFSASGQRWGNPLYRWKKSGVVNEELYRWWRGRFTRVCEMLHMLRIDHFRGFEAYWSIPAQDKTAINGKWIKGPGKFFFDRVMDAAGDMEIVAEDLGTITPEVEELRAELGFPGMKVLQFAFDGNTDNSYLPHNFEDTNCIVYTGTHDNDTTVGWYLDPETGWENKATARRYANSEGNNIHHDFIRLAYSSTAKMAIIPLQDVLGFGSDCRMNKPGSNSNNWRWRCASRFLTPEVAGYLSEEAAFYGR